MSNIYFYIEWTLYVIFFLSMIVPWLYKSKVKVVSDEDVERLMSTGRKF